MVQKLFKFGGGEGSQVDRRFLSFEDKTIDEQADQITQQLLTGEDSPIFEFDRSDRDVLKKFQEQVVAGGITVSLLWLADIKVLNTTQWGMAMGPLRKFGLINVMTLPVYWYFYTTTMQKY